MESDIKENSQNKTVFCINCGRKVKNLYRKYSATVLKLCNCEICKAPADKYIEYDYAVVIIDLILLRIMAYRHILLNSEFKNFWKLSLILMLLESYSNWKMSRNVGEINSIDKYNKTELNVSDFDINFDDLRFYVICFNVTISILCFTTTVYAFTKLYMVFVRNVKISFLLICKTVTLSSTGVFLLLPSIIWDTSIHEYQLHFVTLYTCLSQLLAYKAIWDCPKIWSLIVIFSSYYLKSFVNIYLQTNLLLDTTEFFIKSR